MFLRNSINVFRRYRARQNIVYAVDLFMGEGCLKIMS